MYTRNLNTALTTTFPLENYLTLNDDEDSLKNFNECIRRKPDSLALDKINDLINLAESKLENIIASTSTHKEIQCVYLKEPAYFDDDFDQKSYIEKLVNANVHGMTIIRENKKPKFLEKYMQKYSENIKEKILRSDVISQLGVENSDALSMNEVKNSKYNNNIDRVIKNTKIVEVNSFQEKIVVKNHKSGLSIQNLPVISIRSELIEQKFPLVDIHPSDKDNRSLEKNNFVIVHSKHEDESLKNDNDQNEEAKINVSMEEESEDMQTDPVKKIKFVKLSDDLELNQDIDKPTASNTINSDIRKNEYHSDANKQNPYIFINRTNSKMFDDDTKIFSRNKKISTLKKYGLPEIQKIYNPKQYVHRKVDYAVPKFVSTHNVSYITKSSFPKSYVSRQSVAKNSYSTNTLNVNYQTNRMNSKKTDTNVEYIPYSKLTIGGIRNKELDVHVGYFKKDKQMQSDVEENYSTSTSKSRTSGNIREASEGQNEELRTYSIDTSSDIQDIEDFERENNVGNMRSDKTQKQIKNSKKSSSNIKFKGNKENLNGDHHKATQTDAQYTGDIEKDIRNIEDNNMKYITTTVEETQHVDETSVSNVLKNNLKESLPFIKDIDGTRSTSPKETQTPIMQTVDAMTSPTKEINENIFAEINRITENIEAKQTLVNKDKYVQTNNKSKSSMHSDNSYNETENDEKHVHKEITSSRQSKSRFNISSASDGYVDESKSESSDIQSVGEINLTIFRKKLIRILDETNSHNSRSSFSTSINSNIHLNSTLSSKMSDGEVSFNVNSDKII